MADNAQNPWTPKGRAKDTGKPTFYLRSDVCARRGALKGYRMRYDANTRKLMIAVGDREWYNNGVQKKPIWEAIDEC